MARVVVVLDVIGLRGSGRPVPVKVSESPGDVRLKLTEPRMFEVELPEAVEPAVIVKPGSPLTLKSVSKLKVADDPNVGALSEVISEPSDALAESKDILSPDCVPSNEVRSLASPLALLSSVNGVKEIRDNVGELGEGIVKL